MLNMFCGFALFQRKWRRKRRSRQRRKKNVAQLHRKLFYSMVLTLNAICSYLNLRLTNIFTENSERTVLQSRRVFTKIGLVFASPLADYSALCLSLYILVPESQIKSDKRKWMESFRLEQMDVFMTEMTSWCSFKLLIKSFVGIVDVVLLLQCWWLLDSVRL